MKKDSILYITVFFMLFVTSCIEWSETLYFDIVNNTGQDIIFIQERGIYESDTTRLENNEKVFDFSGGGIGNALPYPFNNCKKIIFIYQDSIIKEFSRETHGKNPLNLEYYEEISRTETKRSTTIDYEYLIESEEFK